MQQNLVLSPCIYEEPQRSSSPGKKHSSSCCHGSEMLAVQLMSPPGAIQQAHTCTKIWGREFCCPLCMRSWSQYMK